MGAGAKPNGSVILCFIFSKSVNLYSWKQKGRINIVAAAAFSLNLPLISSDNHFKQVKNLLLDLTSLSMPTLKSYLSLIKFSHTIFAMPFALIGFFLAIKAGNHLDGVQWNLNKTIGWGWDKTNFIWWKELSKKLLLVILCMVFARSAAMAFNRYLDR